MKHPTATFTVVFVNILLMLAPRVWWKKVIQQSVASVMWTAIVMFAPTACPAQHLTSAWSRLVRATLSVASVHLLQRRAQVALWSMALLANVMCLVAVFPKLECGGG
jgi:hypothetical protein